MEIVAFDLQNYAFVTYSFIQREWSFLSVFLLVLVFIIQGKLLKSQNNQLEMCSSKKYQYLPPLYGRFFCFAYIAPPPRKFQLNFILYF